MLESIKNISFISAIRILGNILNIIGYFVVLYIDPLVGSIIRIVALGLSIPFCIKLKLWDVIILFSFFIVIDLSNIVRILF